jgi:hypothetical protein
MVDAFERRQIDFSYLHILKFEKIALLKVDFDAAR